MTLKVTINPLVRTFSESCQRTAGRKLLAATTLVALSIVFAPVANAQFSFCLINGPATAQCGTQVNYIATSPFLVGQTFNATWSFTNNNAGATFVGPHTCVATQSCQVTVMTSATGTVVIHVILDFGGGVLKTCSTTLTVAGGGPVAGTCPPDIVVPCPGPIDPSVTGTPTFNNNCGQITTTFTDTVTGSNCAGSIITRTWTATNPQGGMGTCTQTISRSSVPIITCPPAVTVGCFSLVPPPDIGTVTATDSCGGAVTVVHVSDVASNGTSNCSNFITRTYRATNACGISTDCLQTITVSDTTPPTISCPGPVTVQCFSAVPSPNIALVTASDGSTCGGAVTIIHVGDVATNGASSCNNVITRTYRATDLCGNQATCTQTITVNDTTPPVLTCPTPGVSTVQCFNLIPAPNIGIVASSDNCGGVVTITHVSDVASNGTSSCNNVVTRTYQGVDACGNAGTCTQMITVNDTTPPSITCPGPVNVQCFSLVPAPSISSVTAADNCGAAPTITFVSDVASNGTSSVNNVITRTYRATDACNNMTTCTQTITVNDTTNPTLTCAGALSVQCFSLVPPPNIATVTATDNCGGLVTVTFMGDVATNGTSSCFNVITRTYQGIDLAGHVGFCTQTITVNDTTPPAMLSCPAPVTVTCFSQVPPPAPTSIVATDNCGGAVVVIHLSDTPSNGNSSCNNVITRTYRATDLCGNQATCTQLITVNDTIPPVLTCPVPGVSTVQCFSLVPAPNIGIISATDNCGGAVTVTFVSDVQSIPGSSCNNVITRTYQGVDACGNIGTCTQMITVNDTTPPSITCPGPLTAQCFTLVPVPNISLVTATDNCGSAPTITFVSDVATNGTSSCMNMITRTYRATDACGNMTTCTQMITVNDTTPPVLTCPVPSTVQCFSLVPPQSPTAVTATDNCGGLVTVTFVGDVPSNGTSSCFNTITRTYMGVDLCGNMATCTQTITVNDTTPPVISSCPPPVTVQCFSLVPPSNIASVTATDNCGGAVTVTFVSDTPSNGNSSCNNVITRTYRATDLCGNMSTCTQAITVNDTTPPVLTCPAPGVSTVQCFSLVPAPNIGIISATDNCGGVVTITFVSDVQSVPGSSCNNVITRTYQGVDACGNTGTCTQMITVNDTTPPSITCPGPATAQCFTLVPAPNISLVTATDNCGSAPTITFVSDVATNGTSSCMNVITRTYRATDACGNMTTCTQMITVNDTTPPVLTCPVATTVQCFSLVPAQSPTAVTATDNCGGAVTVTFVSDVATNGTSNCMNVITRTYMGVDLCGNMATCTQMITVNDTTVPTLTCPTAVTGIQCFSLVPAPNIALVTTTDNCGGVPVVTFVSDVATNGTSSCNNVITRTYRATDACGNMATCTQTITVNDTTPPTVTCPAAVTGIQCFALLPAPNIGLVTATDNCGGAVTVTFVSDVATNGTSSCNNVITRTYRGTDLCNNQSTCTQTITVNDTTLPVISCPPNILNLACGDPTTPATTGTATATDNCNAAPTVTFADVLSGGPCPTVAQTITRTWTANDGCNMATCTQIIMLLPPPVPLSCTFNLGGGCGTPTPVLAVTLPTATTIMTMITGAAPNALMAIVGDPGPFVSASTIVAPCMLFVDAATSSVGSFQTNASGAFTMAFPIPAPPINIRAHLQAVVTSPTQGPIGPFSLTNGVDVWRPCPPCTYSRIDWASATGQAAIDFAAHYVMLFPSGLDVGIFNPGNGSAVPNGIHWTGDVTGMNALKSYLSTTVGTPMALPMDFTNPTSTATSTPGRLTAVLTLNIAFNAAGFLGPTVPGLGNMIYSNPGDSLDGMTVNQLLMVFNNALAGILPLPVGHTFNSLGIILEQLSIAFENCIPTPLASDHLLFP